MSDYFATLESWVSAGNEFLWGPPMMIILIGFGIFATIYFGVPQVSIIKIGWNETFGQLFTREKTNREGSMSSFQSLATAISAQVGTGNIAGVAGAILVGGPGAVFWMWMTALVGMATIFVEAVLAQRYRRTRNGELVAGPAFYISQGLAEKNMVVLGKTLASIFAVLIILALGFIGNMVQSNSIASVMTEAFGIEPLIIGIGLGIVGGLVFIGGMKRIGKFAEMIVPVMALIYFISAISILFVFRGEIIPTIKSIFSEAFRMKAVTGGVAGYTIRSAVRYGVARGLFSNEAGMGSTPNSHGVADVPHPVVQGSVAMLGVFIDTMIVCSATALTILVSGAADPNAGYEGAQITMEAFNRGFPGIGDKFLAIALLFFAFTTVIGWYYFGEANIKYLFKSNLAVRIYQILVICFIVAGTLLQIGFVWELADLFNGLMVIPNVIGLIILATQAKSILKDYQNKNTHDGLIHYEYPYE